MSEVVITADRLGKRYSIGRQEKYRTARESIVEFARSPFRALRPQAQPQPSIWALKDVSFEVRRGEVVGIVGSNGAGKSTLLKVLSRITDPTEGGVGITGRMGSLLEVGTGFHPELTGRENTYLNGAILGMRKREVDQKFNDIVAFAEVEKFLDTPVKHYSSGMYTRLAFSIAAHLEPEILVVDEVLAVGDAEFQKRCIGKMGDVARGGRTVLFVSHNLSHVKRLCSSGLLLRQGAVCFRGPVDQTIKEYLANTAASCALVALSGYRSSHGDGEVEVASVELLNAVGGNFAAPWDAPAQVAIRVRATRDVANVSVAIGCATVEFVPMFTVRSADGLDQPLCLRANEERVITASISHNLRAGFYNLAIGVASGNYAYYFNPSAAQLEVLAVGTAPYPDRNDGLINCPSSWAIT